MGLSREEAPYVSIPLNTVVHLQPGAFSCKETRHTLYRITMCKDGQDEPLAVKLERESAAKSALLGKSDPCVTLPPEGNTQTFSSAQDDGSASRGRDGEAHINSISLTYVDDGDATNSHVRGGGIGENAVDPSTMSVPVLDRSRGMSVDELNNPSSH